ncbi:MAG: lysylphosphatidylglycerol synthase transmembrane domain-containing protein [Solirubrobacteraceae bacterium]
MAARMPDPPPSPDGQEDMPDELHPRHIAIRVAEVAAVVALVAIAITALPGLDQVRDRLQHARPVWLAGAALAEVASCLGYVLAFRATFCPQMSWGLSYDIAMAEQAANSLLPSGGAGGLALGVWALHQAGMATGHIARRTVAFFVVTSAPNFAAVVVAGLLTFVGVFPGDQSVIFTLVPAVIAAAVIEFAWLSPKLLRTFGKPLAATGRERWLDRARHGIRSGLRAAADGVDLAKALLRSHSFGVIVGSFSYLAFDIAALGFGFAAVGPVPPFGTLAMGYLIGQLGNLVPVPGGIGGTEGALVGMFAIYGVNVSDAVAAVFVYRLFQLAVPALLGAPAFILLRRKLMRKHDRALVCTPLSVDVVELPARS